MSERDDEMTDWMPAPYRTPDPVSPLTDTEFDDLKDEWDFHGGWKPHRELVARLVATVEQVRNQRDAAREVAAGALDDARQLTKERDAAHAVIRRMLDGYQLVVDVWVPHYDGQIAPLTPAEVDAIRQAREPAT